MKLVKPALCLLMMVALNGWTAEAAANENQLANRTEALHREAVLTGLKSEELIAKSQALLKLSNWLSSENVRLQGELKLKLAVADGQTARQEYQLRELKENLDLIGKALVEIRKIQVGQRLLEFAIQENMQLQIAETWKRKAAEDDFWGEVSSFIESALEVVLNPAGSVLAGVAKLLPEDLQDALNTVLKPTERLLGLPGNIAKGVTVQLAEETYNVFRRTFWQVVHGEWQNLGISQLHLVIDLVPILVQDLPSKVLAVLPPQLLDGLWGGLENPNLTEKDVINPGNFPAAPYPIYYINGIKTYRNEAEAHAALLSWQLRAPITLLYSATSGSLDEDLALGAYDRTWPYMLAYNIFDQRDHTVARLAWLLVNGPDQKMSFISHSRATLQVRNALQIASLMGHGKPAQNNIAWVAAGAVLTEREVLHRPDRFTMITNDGDLVAGGAQLSFRPPGVGDNDDRGHPFPSYVPLIKRSMIYWPGL